MSVTRKIALRYANRLVCAELGGGIDTRKDPGPAVVANRVVLGAWEEFVLVPIGTSGRQVAIRTFVTGYYLTAEQGGGSVLRTNERVIGPWEIFEVQRMEGKTVAFKTATGHYLSVSGETVDARGTLPVLFTMMPLTAEIPALQANGWEIRTEAGEPWRMIHGTNFLAFYRFLRGEEPPLYDGLDGYRITTAMSVVPAQAGWPALTEDVYPDLYIRFDEFQRWLLTQGKRAEFVGLADSAAMGWDLARQQRHVARITEILAGGPHLFELVNEYDHPMQRVEPQRFTKPSGVFACAGSPRTEQPCPVPAWDYSAQHLARRFPTIYKDATPIEMIAGYESYPGTQGPTLTNEMIGADETMDGWRRSNDPNLFRRLGGILREWNGGCIHIQSGIFSLPLRPREAACVDAFQRALR